MSEDSKETQKDSSMNRKDIANNNATSTSRLGKFDEIVSLHVPRIKKADHSETTPLMTVDEMFRNRWHIQGVIGKGGYGEIYLAIDVKRAEEVAIKAEPKMRRGKLAKRMILEQAVLHKLQGKPHVPIIYASGHTDNMNYIVMQLLSVNLGDLKKQSPVKRLGKSTVGRVLQQAIGALRDLHTLGYIHRDVKPGNMCFGITKNTRHILILLDFGLIRRFKTESGDVRTPRQKAGFRGTHRYVSTRVHSRLEQCPVDDLVSLVYSGYELLIGDLPWKYLDKNDEIKKFKEEMQNLDAEFCKTPDPFNAFGKKVFQLDVTYDIPYQQLQDALVPLCDNKKLSDPYDWEENYKEAIDCSESTSNR